MPEVVAGAEDTKLGLVPQLSDGYVLVKDVSKGGWAETAGIKALARISQINGVQVAGMSDADFKAALKQRPLRIRFEQMFEVVLHDPAEKLGCGFSGVPPGSVTVSKVAPGSFAERHQVEPGYELVALNGTEMHSLAEGAFKEGLKSRPARLRFRVPEAQGDVPDGMMEVVLADADTKLGCGFAGVPPEPVVVGKITPGSFAERNKVQIGYSLVAVNGTEIKSLNADSFKEALKARPVRLRIQIPQEEEKVQTVEKVEKQENAATAIQALARGRAARKGTGLEAGLAGMQEANTFELTLQDAETKLGCGFAGVPPEPVAVGKITPGSFAERNNVQVGYSLVAVNGKDIKNLTSDTFKEALKARPVSLRIQVPQEEEKVQTVQKVEKQENAATAIQALARGRAARKGTGLEAGLAGMQEANTFELTLQDAETKLGCGFAGVPPEPVAVGKITPGSFAERNNVQVGYSLVAVNGKDIKNLTSDTFKEALKARPVSLRIQAPQEEEKVQTVQKVEKQENAATAIQALARGRAARKGTGLEAGLAGMQEANTFELTLQDAETKLGCGFAGVPPEPVAVGKITPGSFAERNNVQVGYSLVAVNGKDIKNLTSDTFKEALKARPVSLRIQVPQEEEKVQTVQKVEKQENAATAIQALARGRAARQASRPLEELEAAVAESDLRTFTVEAAVASLGLEFAGPKPVVSKVLAGGWGERSGILARSEIRSINGQPVVPAEFQAQLEQRPLKLSIAMARGSLHTEQTPSEKVGLADLAAVRAELAAKEKELALARRDLAAANQELKQLKSRALDSGAGQDVSQAEVAELRQKLQQREKDLDALRVQGDPGRGSVQQNASGDELARCMQDLEETKQRLKESEEREHAPRPGTPESGKSVEIKASYWAEVELQALKEELGKKDQQLQKLRKDVAESYAKLKDDDGILRATVPAHFPELGFRLRDDEVSEVKVDGWAAAVGLKLGDRLMMIQNKPLAELRQEQFQEAWQRRPLELGFRRATRQQAQQLASRKIQAQWRGKSARNKSKKAQLEKQQAECEAQAFSVTLEASEEVGFFLETWPPAPKVLIKGVKKDSWAQRVGIKAGQQLLACQKESRCGRWSGAPSARSSSSGR
ncbi:unnamed protein product [Effrenium voratum]|uniref:PDZ domain-containing protein n=1 Tax=Effrenium voratum TaxID=2562239 RepID=A0AA36I247_9DINO|nr:unnamed protein product [Effrenium voratum]